MFLFTMQQNSIKFAWIFLDLTLTKSREFISDREELSVDFDTDHTVIGFSLHILRTLYIEMSTILRILTLIYYVL